MASGMNFGSVFAMSSQCAVDQARPTHPFLGGKLVAEHVEPSGDDLAIDFVEFIHWIRPATSVSGLETGRVGLPPAKANPRLPPSSISFTDGKFVLAARMASSSAGGTRWAWQSMIIPYFPLLSADAAMASLIAEIRIGSLENEMPQGDTASLRAPEMAAGAPR